MSSLTQSPAAAASPPGLAVPPHMLRRALDGAYLAAGAVDAVIVTDMTRPQAAFEDVKARLAPERIMTPRMLRISRNGNGKG